MRYSQKFIARTGAIAALYICLTLVSALFGLSSGAVQLRLGEMLPVLALYSSSAVPGVTVGCLLSNLLLGGTVYDIVFGSIASLIGVLFVRLMRKFPYLSPIPTVISNMVILPFVFVLSGISTWEALPFFTLTVFLGEAVSCGVLGVLLICYIEKHPKIRKLL